MSHVSEKRWDEMISEATAINAQLIKTTLLNEEYYKQFQEVYSYCSNDLTQLANLLHKNDKDLTTASALEITQVTDLRLSLVMHHDVFQCLNNEVVTQRDRYNLLRNIT